MLKLTTDLARLEFEVDGKGYSVPLFLGLTETRELAEMDGKSDRSALFLEWFVKLAERSGVDCAASLGDVQLGALVSEWTRLRTEAGEPDLGKR